MLWISLEIGLLVEGMTKVNIGLDRLLLKFLFRLGERKGKERHSNSCDFHEIYTKF